MRHLIIAIVVTSVAGTLWLSGNYPQGLVYIDKVFSYVEGSITYIGQNAAAVILNRPITVAELKGKYTTPQEKVRILIVPGHEPNYGGAEYGTLKERNMTVELARYLAAFLKNNERYEVIVARDTEMWNPTLQTYFDTKWDEIVAFFQESKVTNLHRISNSNTPLPQFKPKVLHNSARTDVAVRLYGMNKWGNENGVDIALHIHFNDHPRKNPANPGRYTGFSIYIPEEKYGNNPTTKAVAQSVFKRLSKYNAVSNLPVEDEGIVEDEELIAIGAHNTSNAASLLVEYGYIYEPQFQSEITRKENLRDMAFQTYLGLQDFFGSGNDVSLAYDTLMLPYKWENNVSSTVSSIEDVLALQSALIVDGVYPSNGKSKNDCPRTGRVGPCTLGAIESFQKKYGVQGEVGYVGEKTRSVLNSRFSF